MDGKMYKLMDIANMAFWFSIGLIKEIQQQKRS